MSQASSISVVIPCYNGAAYVREALDSVLAQTQPVLEVLVIDDGSTDDSAAIAEAYGAPVRVIRQANQGESVARNRGLDEAKGEWVAFLDADDLWKPEKLAAQLAVADQETVAVHTNYYEFGRSSQESHYEQYPPEVRYDVAHILKGNPIYISSLLVRRERSPRFPVWTKYAEDMIYTVELLQRGSMRLAEGTLCGYRTHARSQTAQHPAIETCWLATIMQWLQQSDTPVPDRVARDVRDSWLDRLVTRAWLAKTQRNWERYWALRRHLSTYEGHAGVDRLLANRIYPRWVYRVADQLPLRR